MSSYQSEECPSLMYWFRKDALNKVSWSMPVGCSEGHEVALPNMNLAGDWNRYEDSVVNIINERTWRFVGLRNFDEDLTVYGFQDYKHVRIYVQDSKNKNAIYHNIYDIQAKYWE